MTSCPPRETAARDGPTQPDQGLDQLILAVAGHAGDAEDLARPDLEADAAARPRCHGRRLTWRSRHDEPGVGRMRSRRGRPSAATSRPTISSARSPSSVAPGSRSPTTRPRRMTVIRSAISRTSYSLWLMKMMLRPSVGQPAEDGEDLLGLLRGQDRRGLVEDEDPGIAIEGLEDLDALLPADGQVADLGLGVDLEAEPPTQVDDPPMRPPCGRGRSRWPSSPRRGGCSRRP